jgi:hypothetical protein
MNEQFVRDAIRKYSGSFVMIQQTTDLAEFPVYIREIGSSDNGVASLFASIVTPDNSIENIKFNFKDIRIKPTPKSRVFDANGMTFVYKRKIERQWTRGISNNNSSIYSPITNILELSFKYDVQIDYERADGWSLRVLKNLFTSQTVSLEEAISILSSGKAISKSVTKQNWISLSPKDNVFLLWWMDRIIASFNPQEQTAEVIEVLYRQEVVDFFRRQGVYYGI